MTEGPDRRPDQWLGTCWESIKEILGVLPGFTLDANLGREDGDQRAVGITYESLPQDVRQGDRLILDDGQIVLRVTAIDGAKVHTEVAQGGRLSNSKGINRQGGGLSAKALR